MNRSTEDLPAFDAPPPWRGPQLFERDDWEVRLSEADVEELVRAARMTEETPLEALDAASLELPRLAGRLASIQDSLETGSGVTRIRGLPPDLEESLLGRIFWILALGIGTPVSQNAVGERLLYVRDESFGRDDPRVRGPYTRKRLSFHTDRCDVIAFLCVRAARSGGESDVISSVALYHEMMRLYPDPLRVLCEPFVYLRHTVDSGNDLPFVRQPIFSVHQGHFAASFLRVLIDRADREPDVPDLTEAQRDALEKLEAVAEDPDLYARFRQEPGDILFINNWVTFHRRTAFEDHTEASRRRLLLRLWLSVPNSRPLDPSFAANFGATAAGALRGGMRPGQGGTPR